MRKGDNGERKKDRERCVRKREKMRETEREREE